MAYLPSTIADELFTKILTHRPLDLSILKPATIQRSSTPTIKPNNTNKTTTTQHKIEVKRHVSNQVIPPIIDGHIQSQVIGQSPDTKKNLTEPPFIHPLTSFTDITTEPETMTQTSRQTSLLADDKCSPLIHPVVKGESEVSPIIKKSPIMLSNLKVDRLKKSPLRSPESTEELTMRLLQWRFLNAKNLVNQHNLEKETRVTELPLLHE